MRYGSFGPRWSLLVVLFLLGVRSRAQGPGPLQLAQLIFGPAVFPQLDRHITGEYDGKPNGTNLSEDVQRQYLVLDSTAGAAVVALELSDAKGVGADAYLFFERDTVWKMSAMRGLAMTGIIETIQQELARLSDKQVNRIIREAKDDTLGIGLFKSREEYEFMLGNTRLTIARDRDIISHFEAHRGEFERIKDVALAELARTPVDAERSTSLATAEEAVYRKLFITSVSQSYELGAVLNFLIGGMVDNSVGYFYASAPEFVPEINASRIIMVRAIGNGWYMYKTT